MSPNCLALLLTIAHEASSTAWAAGALRLGRCRRQQNGAKHDAAHAFVGERTTAGRKENTKRRAAGGFRGGARRVLRRRRLLRLPGQGVRGGGARRGAGGAHRGRPTLRGALGAQLLQTTMRAIDFSSADSEVST